MAWQETALSAGVRPAAAIGTGSGPGLHAVDPAPQPGGLISLTYVSECRIPPGEAASQIDAIVAVARQHNARSAITGALLFTGSRFVQTLEGPPDNVDALMLGIVRDERHSAVAVIARQGVTERNFARWSLGYAGPSLFVAKAVSRGLAGAYRGLPGDVDRLLRLITEFSKEPPFRQVP